MLQRLFCCVGDGQDCKIPKWFRRNSLRPMVNTSIPGRKAVRAVVGANRADSSSSGGLSGAILLFDGTISILFRWRVFQHSLKFGDGSIIVAFCLVCEHRRNITAEVCVHDTIFDRFTGFVGHVT